MKHLYSPPRFPLVHLEGKTFGVQVRKQSTTRAYFAVQSLHRDRYHASQYAFHTQVLGEEHVQSVKYEHHEQQ